MSPAPVIAVLTAHWESKSESGWIVRQVAGALACEADVHIVTPDGDQAGQLPDGAFTLHQLATPIAPTAELRRELLVEALSSSKTPWVSGESAELSALLDRDLIDPWEPATHVLNALRPDHVVIAGHQNVGALKAVERTGLGAPISLIALGSEPHTIGCPHFGQVFSRARTILAVTETERLSIVEHHGRPEAVIRIGAPMAANPSALTEPNGWAGNTKYILVLTDSASEEDHPHAELCRLIRLRFPDMTMGFSHTDAFCVWNDGRLHQGWAIEKSSDLARLLAWAHLTIDLAPGPLFARRCVDSLLYSTPIVVPEDSAGREHAERGRGGLWFGSPIELTWCIEAMADQSTRDTFGAQGRRYVEAEYGSTDRFIDRVATACGLAAEPRAEPVVA
jgi:hypothetical protein